MRTAVGLMDGMALMVIGVSSVIPRQGRSRGKIPCVLDHTADDGYCVPTLSFTARPRAVS